MIETDLEKLKKEYIRTNLPPYLVDSGWVDLRLKLSTQRATIIGLSFARAALFTFMITLVITASIIGASQNAKPGDTLYPVKILSDNVIAKITGDLDFKIHRRAQEVIDASSKPSDNLEDANREYQQTLEEAKEEAEKQGKGQELRNTLDQQEEKFRQSQRENPASQNKLEEAIKHTEQTKGEVQGQKDEHPQPVNNGQNNSNGQQNQKGKNK